MFSKDFDHKDIDHKKFNHNIHIVSPSYYWGVLNLLPNFQIGGLDRISILDGGRLWNTGVTLFRGSVFT